MLYGDNTLAMWERLRWSSLYVNNGQKMADFLRPIWQNFAKNLAPNLLLLSRRRAKDFYLSYKAVLRSSSYSPIHFSPYVINDIMVDSRGVVISDTKKRGNNVVIIADGHQQSRAEETDKSHAVFISVGFGSDGHGLAPHEIPISSLNIGKVYSNKTAISNPSSLGEFFVSQVCTRPSGNIFRSSAYTGARVQNWDGMTITTFVQKSGID